MRVLLKICQSRIGSKTGPVFDPILDRTENGHFRSGPEDRTHVLARGFCVFTQKPVPVFTGLPEGSPVKTRDLPRDVNSPILTIFDHF